VNSFKHFVRFFSRFPEPARKLDVPSPLTHDNNENISGAELLRIT